jgi:pimeloyl-ACP methyl ester carboxylesterase
MTNSPETAGPSSVVHYRFAEVSKHDIFYREAGPANAPAVLLLHGFPTSSHMFRDLVPELAERHRVIAPDLPGFGFTVSPSAFEHTFDHLADVIDAFTDTIGMRRYAVYVFDYGAPVGFRLALKHPERITAMITQNGNAYEEGIGKVFDPMRDYWREPSAENRNALRELLKRESIQWQYTQGVADTSLIAPESYALDAALLARPGNDEIARSVPGLSHQRCAVFAVPGVLPHTPSTTAGHLGQERPDFRARRSRGIQTRHSGCGNPSLRNRPLRAGNARDADRRCHPRFFGAPRGTRHGG